MKITAKELATMLSGCQYGIEMSRYEEQMARENGLVVVFGRSDDNAEFRGAINDEAVCYDGSTIYLTKDGVLSEPGCGDTDCKHYKSAIQNAVSIDAVWCDPETGASLSYHTAIPHETFNIYEDDELYCVGIVFSMEDLK